MNPGMAIYRKHQRLQRGTENLEPGTSNVRHLQEGDEDPAPRRPLTEKELRRYEPWIRDMIRSIPWREKFKGPQFNPRDVPIIEGSPAGQLMYDPTLSGREDLQLLAQKGTGDVRNPGLIFFRKHMLRKKKP
jgi:hypothetical protein